MIREIIDWLDDAVLELSIGHARRVMLATRNREARVAAWNRMARLISLRSPKQVARMERKAGLR